MFFFHASEKDCIGQDGEGVQECVICLEEFAVGDEMGRLVCLCKFHRVSFRLLRFWMCYYVNSEGTNRRIRHVYDSGGLRKVQGLALCIQMGRHRVLKAWYLVTIITVLKTLHTRECLGG